MKTKKRLLMFCGLVFALVLSISLSVGVMFAGTTPELTTSTTLEASYELGTELEIPQGTLTVGENSAAAETIVVFPNGAAYKTTLAQLTQEGKYTVQYRATIAGKLYVVEKTFFAESKLYSCSSGTKYEYGTYVAADHNPKNFQPTGGEVTGLKVSLAGGDIFRYNEVIDLNTLTKDDQILKFALTPSEIGTPDTQAMFMYLTDAYDPENVITIKIRQPDPVAGYSNIYMSAAAPDQSLTGWEWNSGRKHVGGNYGSPFRANFAGYFKDGNGEYNSPYLSTIQENTVSFSMNYAERELHCTIRPASSSSTVVADFDNPQHFGSLWGGFTTGEVFVSVTSSSPANFVITELAGRDVSNMDFGERTKPTITVDYGEYTAETVPSAVVGQPYPLFDAVGRSPYVGDLEVDYRVYGNYYASNRYELLVVDGVFTPTVPGTYFIAYEARDNFGQIGSTIIPIEAVANPAEMVITRNDSIGTGIAGHPVQVSMPTVTNNVGNAKVVATYAVDGGAPVVIEEGKFVPTKAGTYTVTLTATDYVSRVKAISYTVEVDAGTKPVFEKEPMLPKAFIAGCEYFLPIVSAYNYTDGSGSAVKVTISAQSSSAQATIPPNGRYLATASKDGEVVTIKYSATINGKGTEEWSKDVPVVLPKDENGDLHLERFLIKEGEGITAVVAGENYTTVSFADAASAVTWANPVLASGLNVEFSSADVADNYEGISVALQDAENPDQMVVINYVRSAKGASVYQNYDLSESRTAAQFFTNAEEKFLLSYVADTKAIKFDPYNSEEFAIKTYANGKPFAGFDSGKVYVSFHMDGVTKLTKMNVVSVSAQAVNNSYTERLGPRIAATGSYGGTINYGETVTICSAIVADVVDPSVKCYLTIKAPDNSYVMATDGTLLKAVAGEKAYEITLTQNGKYRISYEATDMNGNDALKFSYVITVPDNDKPVITVHNKIATTGKVGKAIGVPEYSVSDNLSTAEEITSCVMVISAQGNSFVLKPEIVQTENGPVINRINDGFTPNRAGKYIIRYTAYDAEGNFTILDFVVEVTE